MGPGHFGVALAVKPLVPKAPVWALLAASELLDMLCMGFVALGLENAGVGKTDLVNGVQISVPASISWSHSLVMSLGWSIFAAGIAYLLTRSRLASAAIGLVAFSHWVLDFIVHLPDLPFFLAGSPKLGLGMWGSGAGVIISGVLEVLLIAGGLFLYLRGRGIFNRNKPLYKGSIS